MAIAPVFNPVVKAYYPLQEQFATLDGVTKNWQLETQGLTDITVLRIDGIYLTNWQGTNALRAYSRTNYATYSNAIQNWTANDGGVLTGGQSAPDGSSTACNIAFDGSSQDTGALLASVSNGAIIPSGTTVYYGAVFKYVSGQTVAQLSLEGSAFGSVTTQKLRINPSAGTVSTVGATVTSNRIVPLGNGFFYAELSAVTTAAGTLTEAIYSGQTLGASVVTASNVWLSTVPLDVFFAGPTTTVAGPVSQTDYSFNTTNNNVVLSNAFTLGNFLLWSGEAITQSSQAMSATISRDLMNSVTWRFDSSVRLQSLLAAKQAWYANNNDTFWDNWYNSTFNLKTANNFGCSVWANILNVPVSILGLRENFRLWGFDAFRANFENSTTEGANPGSGNFPPIAQNGGITSVQEAIWALRLKYYVHTTQRTVLGINALLNDVFNSDQGVGGTTWVLDNQDMTMTYVFNFSISSALQAAMTQYDLLPKVAGVKIIIQVNP